MSLADWTPDPLVGWRPPPSVRPHVHDYQRSPQQQWKDYTPELGNVTIGNGGVAGRYKLLEGRTLVGRVTLRFGSTSSIDMGEAIQIGVPPGFIPSGGVDPTGTGGLAQVAFAVGIDSGGGHYFGAAVFSSIGPLSSGSRIFTIRDVNGFWNNTNPITWGSGDVIIVNFLIEVEPI